jgi:hypothetical protein
VRSSLRRRAVVVAIAAASSSGALLAVACNQVAGLDDFREVDCFQAPCDASVADVVTVDAHKEAGDASADGFVPDAGPIVDAGVFEHRTWAHWKMPNADAGGTPLLPNLMRYDAGPDNGEQVISDFVSGLQWQAKLARPSVPSLQEAVNVCAKPGGWRVPTRIELVTLLDVTRTNPALHEAFLDETKADHYGGGTAKDLKQFWSASPVAGQAGTYWSVNFETGKVERTNGNTVRCVRGGPNQ